MSSANVNTTGSTSAMLPTDVFKGNSYEVVAFGRGQEPVLYQTFGSYQGEWLMLAKDAEHYYVYKDWYGSCSGCDSFEGEFGYDEEVTRERAAKFAEGYRPFIEIPKETMRGLVRNNRLKAVMPANIRDDYSDIDLDGFCADATLQAKIDLGEEVTTADILDAKNQEVKQRALKAFGYERFVAEAHMDEIDRDGENTLLRKGDVVFAFVKDSSTPRRYLLRVPPDMVRVKQAIAWTFNMTEAQYRPLAET